MNETILKLLLGGAIGVICKIIYDKISENSEKKRIKELLMVEMHSNIEKINNLLSEIKCIDNSPIKEALESYSLEETAKLIDKACKKEILNKCIEKLPYLGKDQMKMTALPRSKTCCEIIPKHTIHPAATRNQVDSLVRQNSG